MEKIKFSIEKEEPIEKCPEYEWMNTPYADKRYQTVGYVSLDLLQKSSGVYQAIDTILPLKSIDTSDVSFGI